MHKVKTSFVSSLVSNKLNIVAFINGALVLIVELVAVRVIAPYFGTSYFVWTSIIGVILASLSFGYWWGGKLADQKPSLSKLSKVVFMASIMILFAALFQHPVLSFTSNLSSDLRLSSLVASLILFSPVSILFGIVSPYIVKLEITSLKSGGSAVGKVFAAGTIGSIVGVFATGYILIGAFGSTKLLIFCAAICLLNSFILERSTWLLSRVVVLLFTLILIFSELISISALGKGQIADIDTTYSRYIVNRVTDTNNDVLLLQTDSRSAQSGISLKNPTQLLFEYIQAFEIYKLFNQNPSRIAIIGGGANIYPFHLGRELPNTTIDTIEIDPALKKITDQYFLKFDKSNVNTINADGRIFVNETSNKYDVFFIDAFTGTNVPFQLTTLEFVTNLKNTLNQDGLVIANLISLSDPSKQKFLESIYTTYSERFANVGIYAVPPNGGQSVYSNYLLVASDKNIPTAGNTNEVVARILNQRVNLASNSKLINTDDFAPIEQYLNNI